MSDANEPPPRTAASTPPEGSTAEARLQGLIALSTEAIVSTDEHQRIVLFNRGAEEVFGYDAAEALGQPLSMLLPRALQARHVDLVDATFRAGDISRRMGDRQPVRGCRRNGEEFEALISISTLRLASGLVATAIVRDVSQLRAAEVALTLSEARYRTLVEASPVGIYTVGLDGRVIEANPAFARMLGTTPAGARGVALPDLLQHPGDWQRIVSAVHDGVQYPATEHHLRTVDGRAELVLLIKAVRVPSTTERVDAVHLFALDVTARRQLEETVRRTEQLDLIGRLAGGVAHDFNNLLLVIRMSASMLGEEAGLSEQATRDLRDLDQAAIRAGELIQQLLAFGRRQVLRPATLDLGALVERQSDLLRRLLGEDVQLRLALGPTVARVTADESQLERVLANLATNARDAMPARGMVEIRVGTGVPSDDDRARCVELDHAEWVHLSFADSGSGIEAATLGRIFDPFYTTKAMGRGTGLGLASVYGIVTRSGGCISVESARGRGTVFHLWFPLAEPSTAERVDPRPTAEAKAIRFRLPATVLLIEDDPAVRRSLERILTERGLSVISAEDGRSAILSLSAHEGPVHAVISDIVLPGESGQRVVDWIAERHPDVRVLFISGHSPEMAGHRGALREGSAFLAKPFAPEDLLRHIADLLAGTEPPTLPPQRR